MKLKQVFIVAAVSMAVSVNAEDGITIPKPNIHGTLRPRYEYAVDDGDMRFQVRDARVGVDGSLCRMFDYKAEVELCDKGSMKTLDVWGRVNFAPQFKAQLGNMRMPFNIGSMRAPHQYLFADRATTDKQVASPRNVGLKLIYSPTSVPLTIEGGVFNSKSNSNQQVWQDKMAAAAKARYRIGDMSVIAGFQSLMPGNVRANHFSGSLTWETSSWLLEGEYVYRHYDGDAAPEVHAYDFMANYGIPVKLGCFNRLSFQGRWDGITDYSDGVTMDDDGHLAITTPAFNRLTAGATISYVMANVRCDFRLNYENYFYHSGVTAPDNDRNKLVAELVVRF